MGRKPGASGTAQPRRYSGAMPPRPWSAAGDAVKSANLNLTWLDSAPAVANLAGEWDGLLGQMPRPNPFLSWTWMETWIRHFAATSRLAVLAARDADGTLVGVAPLHAVRRGRAGLPLRTLEFLGYRGATICADHLDFLAAEPRRQEVCAALLTEILRRHSDWDAIVLADLAEDSPLPELAPALAPGLACEIHPAEICYYCALPDDFATLHAGTKRSRLNLRNRSKRLAQQGEVRFLAPVPEGEIDATLRELQRLHGLARQRQGQANSFERADYFAFHQDLMRKLAQTGHLYLTRLELNGVACAVFYGFTAGEVLYFYQSGFDPALAPFGVGTLQMAAVLEDAITRLHAREFDFLRGAEEYKTYWTSTARHTRTLRLWNRGWNARLHQGAWRGRRRLTAWRQRHRSKPTQSESHPKKI